MAKDLTKLGPKGLATELERREARLAAAGGKLYSQATHGMERFSEIVNRLGADHPLVAKYNTLSTARAEAIAECRRRYGQAVTFDSLWVTFLRVRG